MEPIVTIQSYIRRFFDFKRVAERSRLQYKRFKILEELLSTEDSYLKSLKLLIKDIIEPLTELSLTDNPILTKEELDKIFPSTIGIIYNLNLDFRETINNLLQSFNAGSVVGPDLLNLSLQLRLYIVYVNTYASITSALSQCGRNQLLQGFLGERFGIKDVSYVEGLLVTPIQRITRYQMLFEQLLRNTWDDHPDKETIHKAVQKLMENAEYINQGAKSADRLQRLFTIQASIIDMKEGLVAPQRKYVMEGSLLLFIDGEWKERYFFLFNDLFLITQIKEKIDKYKYIDGMGLKKLQIYSKLKFPSVDPSKLNPEQILSIIPN
eukprot:TRINITY_DN4210_c0_g1_i1.p1 TRINITY_DN4210_c0_g1~~TRINITY_DN4210_c0_g1_i1.p1  ORF type:complete len:323 (-),score=50.77 TRINITY_DN4210_c0_g1_i1:199-1167(-)